jgi:hypothetical protein
MSASIGWEYVGLQVAHFVTVWLRLDAVAFDLSLAGFWRRVLNKFMSGLRSIAIWTLFVIGTTAEFFGVLLATLPPFRNHTADIGSLGSAGALLGLALFLSWRKENLGTYPTSRNARLFLTAVISVELAVCAYGIISAVTL